MSALGAALTLLALAQEPGLEYLEPQDSTGTSKAVVVTGRALVYTSQIFPVDGKGDLVGKGALDRQIDAVLGRLSETLGEAGSDLDRAVRIHVYAREPAGVDRAKTAFAARFKGRAKPAATFISGELPLPGALVAMDAVAAAPPGRNPKRNSRKAAVLPSGRMVFISGQAGNGALPEATRRTLASLESTLGHVGSTWADVVQIKVFMNEVSAAETVKSEIGRISGPEGIPPLVFVEWRLETPIEIELVAAGHSGEAEPAETIRFITPPGMKASPVYSLVTSVERGRLIFTSGLTGSGDPESQVRGIFGALRDLLGQAGSDLGHLAKATYYVTDEGASAKLTQVRRQIYDPARPPAASKAVVRGVGAEGKAVLIDMIAVTRP
jgi:enamine deaminase RidA (YjgF/YER057c/UK114 family)